MESEGSLNKLVKPVSWLVGKWKSTNGIGCFPGIKSFTYDEVIEFQTSGLQPVLKYLASSTNTTNGSPMHLEAGFLRGVDSEKFSFMVAHNFGVTSIEEGEMVREHELILKSVCINRMTSAKDPAVLNMERTFKFDPMSETLLQEIWMSTTTVPELTKHLVASYVR